MSDAWREAASDLLTQVRPQLPSRPVAALRVLAMTADPDVGVIDISHHVARDAGLTGRVLRAANSAYYGLAGRAATVHFAVSVIGFQTLRAIAAGVAAGIGGTASLPDGYVRRYATTAAFAQQLARPAGADPAECYGIGLLHNLGDWLLHLYDPSGDAELRIRCASDVFGLASAQQQRYGCTSGQLAAALLSEWQLPVRFCTPIGNQHEAEVDTDDAATIVLQAALALAVFAEDDFTQVLTDEQQGRLDACGAPADLEPMMEQARSEAGWIIDLLR